MREGRDLEKREKERDGWTNLSKTFLSLKAHIVQSVLCRLRTYIGRLFIVVDVVDVPGQAKVSDLHDVALCDQDVPGCQVSVYTLGWRE